MGGHGKRAPQKQQEWEVKVSRVLAGNELLPRVFGFGRDAAQSGICLHFQPLSVRIT